MARDSSDAASLMKSVRDEVVMTTYSVAMVAATVLMLGNMARNLSLGNSLIIPYAVLYAAFLATYILRRRIGAKWLAPFMLAAMFAAGTIGYLSYGFIGNSAPIFMATCAVAASFYGIRGGLIAALASAAVMLVAASLAFSGHLVYSYDAPAFINSPLSWIAALITFATMSAMVLTQMGMMHRKLESVLDEQRSRMKELEQTNARLGKEIAAREAVETELRRQSVLLTSIVTGLPQGITVVDEKLRLLFWNDVMIDILELPPEIVVRNVAFADLIRIPAQRGDYGPGDPDEQVRARCELALSFQPHSFERVRPGGRTHLVVGKPFHVDGRTAGFITTYTDITERKQAELEVQRSNEVLKSILDNMPGGVTVVNGDLRVIAWNQQFKQLLEMPDELFAEPRPAFESFIRYNAARGEYGSENRERKVEEILERARNFVAHVFERERPNGTVLEIRGVPLPQGGFVTIYTDITARKNAERELLRLHERASLALKTVGVGIFDWDTAKNQLLADARVFEMFGVSAEGRHGHFDDWSHYLHPQDRERAMSQIVASLRGRETDVKLAYRIVRPDGSVRHMEVHNHIVRDAEGRTLRLIGADLDVTERKETEERLLLTEKVFDNSPVAIVITDSENRIISVNQAFVNTTGYAESEVLGRDPKMLGSGQHDKEFFAGMWRDLNQADFWEGEIWDRRKTGEIYPKWMTINVVHDRENAERIHYVGIFSDITERKQAEQHIHHLAHHDALTDLPNRMALEARLEQSLAEAERNGCSVAVMFIDLDRFKIINDTLGHHVGDRLLVEVARRLRHTVRSSDTVARLGGDEFVVVLPALETPSVATTVASGILAALGAPYLIEDKVLHSTPSIGVSIYPRDGGDVATVMKYADSAMYHAKESGRNGFQFFSPELNHVAMERLDIERQLREALKREQFVLHYQPRIDRDGRINGIEALIRWDRPGRELALPDQFIPLAEESDLIIRIGEWVLTTVVRQLRTWLDDSIPVPAVAINLSARQLRMTELPKQIADMLERHAVPARLLEFEVTESMAMTSPERSSGVMGELRKMGHSLAIDDFGTGYSSLSYIKHLPFHRLKIDRSFVSGIAHDPGDLAIIRGTIALAHSIGLKVVAEGPETAEQAALLRSAGCDEFQGFHFSRPLPVDELEAFLDTHSPDTAQP